MAVNESCHNFSPDRNTTPELIIHEIWLESFFYAPELSFLTNLTQSKRDLAPSPSSYGNSPHLNEHHKRMIPQANQLFKQATQFIFPAEPSMIFNQNAAANKKDRFEYNARGKSRSIYSSCSK